MFLIIVYKKKYQLSEYCESKLGGEYNATDRYCIIKRNIISNWRTTISSCESDDHYFTGDWNTSSLYNYCVVPFTGVFDFPFPIILDNGDVYDGDVEVTIVGAGGGKGSQDHQHWHSYGGAGGGGAIKTFSTSTFVK